jgi:hypothetical protein
VDSFQKNPTSHKQNQTFNLSPTSRKLNVWSPYLSFHYNLGTIMMFLFHASVHISWVLVSQLILCHDKFFFNVVNLRHLHGVTLSYCGCDSGLNWTFEMCSACLNILYLTVCVVIFLLLSVVKVLQRMLNFSVLCIHFSLNLFCIHIPW